MFTFICRRLIISIPTLLAVMSIIFILVRIVPGDPAQTILGDQASASALDAMRERLGLNRPLLEQYFDFMGSALTGDWGESMVTGKPILGEVVNVLPYTLELTFVAVIFGVLTGLPLGIWSALHRNQLIDYLVRLTTLIGLSFPAFVSAILLLIVFAINLGWFPVICSGGRDDVVGWFRDLAMPALTRGTSMTAYIARVSRASMLGVLSEDYIRTARAKGVPNNVIIWHHALRNALIPVVTMIGLFLGVLVGNSVLTEIVFNRPGLGKLIVGALGQRDYTMLQGLMVCYAFIIIFINMLTDLTYGLIDPRVKNQ